MYWKFSHNKNDQHKNADMLNKRPVYNIIKRQTKAVYNKEKIHFYAI